MKFYTLFHLRDDQNNANLAQNGQVNMEGYVKCCETLHTSLKTQGFGLTVLSNQREAVQKHVKTDMPVVNIDFRLNVPSEVRFYSAHFKIDAFHWLSQQGDDYSILLDSDVICINTAPINLQRLVNEKIATYYDITDQVYPAYGRETIVADKEVLMQAPSIGNWAGGEWIGGTGDFFRKLYAASMVHWPRYVENYAHLHHQGDEMIVSCAIESLSRNGLFIFDVGKIGGIARHWSAKTLHVARPVEALYDHFLLHLPADKTYLGSFSIEKINNFSKHYGAYLPTQSQIPNPWFSLLLSKTQRLRRFLKRLTGR